MDVFSKSDPMCVVYMRPFGARNFVEVARTECIQNTLNPQFTRKCRLTYLFEETQRLRFEMYDLDSKSARLDDHDYIGSAECTLAEVVTAPNGNALALELNNEREGRAKRNGTLLLSFEELSSCKDDIELQFMGKKLDKKDFFGSSDPFLQFSRSNEAGGFTVTHRTEHISNNVNPLWKKFSVPLRTLCNGDVDRNLKVECFDHNKSGSHSLIGEFFITARQLQRKPIENAVFDVVNPKKKVLKRRSIVNSAVETIWSCLQ